MNSKKMILDKNTLLVYLINELGNNSVEVTTILDEDGCWTGHLVIKETDAEPTDIENYYNSLGIIK